jgi:hypothetical protein
MPLNLFNNAPDHPSRDEIMAQLLARLPEVLGHLFPAGVIRQQTFEIGNLRGDKGQSLKITLQGDKAGLWKDFESDEGGDIFDLWAVCHGLNARTQFKEVLRSISDYLGMTPSPINYSGHPTATWDYLDSQGRILATVSRYDTPQGKTYRPWDAVAGKTQMPMPRSLYNLPGIAAAQKIVLVEGEKAAQTLIDRHIPATTTMGGASSLRGYYSSGMIIYRPHENRPERMLVYELRNGPAIPEMMVDKREGRWIELDQDRQPILRKDYADKLRAELLRKQDQVIRHLYEDALDGTLYTMEQFSRKYEDVDGLGSQVTIQRDIKVALTRGHIKCFKEAHPATGQNPSRSKYGYLCVEYMELGPSRIDPETGEVADDRIPILPTHYLDPGSGVIRQVENREVWLYPPDAGDTSKNRAKISQIGEDFTRLHRQPKRP